MFVRPSIVGGTLRRSNWKSIKESSYFVLQQKNGNNNTSNQQNNNKRRQHYTEYRIITKGFPHYRVSGHDDLNQIQDAFDILHQEVLPEVEGKKTSKKILKQLKSWCATNENLTLPFDEDGYASDTSITPEEGNSSNEMEDQDNDTYPLISPEVTISSNSSSSSKFENAAIISTTTNDNSNHKGKSKIIAGEDHDISEQLDFAVNNSDYSEDVQSSDGSDNEIVTGNTTGGAYNLGASMLDALMGWLEGPPMEVISATPSSSKQVNGNTSSNNKNQTILDIPMQFIDLLTFPEIDPKASKKASFAVLREISFVKQRRKVLFFLTLYMFLIRLCSFDLFLVLVFVSNCAMLFLMKNSGKVNVTMAKRAVRQRIGWAKQWAGSLFKNKTNNIASNGQRKNSNNTISSINSVNASTGAINNVKITPSSPTQAIQTTNMTKSTSHDALQSSALQSGSMSDTTHGGNVSAKITTPKRGVFFRNKGNQASTTSQTNVKEDKVSLPTTETSSLTGFSQLQKSTSDFSLPSITGTNSSNLQISSSISGGGGNTNESPQSSNTSSNSATIQQLSQSPTTKRKFFTKRNNNNNPNNTKNHSSNNNFTLPNIVPTSPLQNGLITATLPDILNDSSSSKSSQTTITLATNTSAASGGEINGSEGSNEGLQQKNYNSSSIVDGDLDTYYEGEMLKFLVGDLKVK